jgi:hypothetical protein
MCPKVGGSVDGLRAVFARRAGYLQMPVYHYSGDHDLATSAQPEQHKVMLTHFNSVEQRIFMDINCSFPG